MDHPTCPYCGGKASYLLCAQDWNRRIDETTFHYYRCACGVVFLSSPPKDLTKYYSEEYHVIPPSVEAFAPHLYPEAYKLKMIQRWISQGRLLDIGPSVGGFLYLAKKAGFETHALEMDPGCCQFIRDCLHIPTIESGDIPRSLQGQTPFTMITLWHVIEHVENPWNDLRAIVHALAPKGYLLIAAPNPESLQFRLFKSRWTHLDAPRHVTLIPPSILTTFLKNLGLELVEATSSDPGGHHWNLFGWERSFRNLFPHLSGRLSKKIFSLAARGMRKIVTPIESKNMLGTAYTMTFQKKNILPN